MRIARVILTVELALGVVLSFLLDWSSNHLLHPAWHPHARFHGALLLFFLAGTSATALWLLWRRSMEPLVAIDVAVLVMVAFWTPLFYITSVLPGSTAWAGPAGAEPLFLPNLAVAALFLMVALAARAVARRTTSQR